MTERTGPNNIERGPAILTEADALTGPHRSVFSLGRQRIARLMRNKTLVSIVFCIAVVQFVASCAGSHSKHSAANASSVTPVTNDEIDTNDRSKWIDGPSRDF